MFKTRRNCKKKHIDYKKKAAKLFDTIPKTRTVNRFLTSVSIFHIKEETYHSCDIYIYIYIHIYIDYVRIIKYDVKNLLHYELKTSFFLTKDGYIRKPRKSDLATDLKKMFEGRCPQSFPATVDKRMMIIDFMKYAHKVPIKKVTLTTFSLIYVTTCGQH